jgi:hypothetical protein
MAFPKGDGRIVGESQGKIGVEEVKPHKRGVNQDGCLLIAPGHLVSSYARCQTDTTFDRPQDPPRPYIVIAKIILGQLFRSFKVSVAVLSD